MDPATEYSAACAKLSWWQDEVRRMAAGKAVHPIGIYLASLPGASAADFGSLSMTLDAAIEEASGAPLERSGDLERHAQALRGNPLMLASHLAGARDETSLAECTRALAVAEYLAGSLGDYQREARFGRVPFVVEELAANGIDNADLSAESAPARLEHFLGQLREQALLKFDAAARALPTPERAAQRHLLVLAALGRRRLQQNSSARRRHGLQDMLLAWRTARRAARSLPE